MRRSSILRTAGIALISAGALAGVGSLVVRDQLSRHQRGLFSGQALKRFAALGYLSGTPASVELVQLLRDFCSWEQNTILRRRAQQVIARMERQLEQQNGIAAEGGQSARGSAAARTGGAADRTARGETAADRARGGADARGADAGGDDAASVGIAG